MNANYVQETTLEALQRHNILKKLPLAASITLQKRASCSKSIDILQQTCYQQAGIRNAFPWIVDDKSVASCEQTCRKLIVKTRYPQAC